MFRPHLDDFRINTKMNADTKLSVIMWCLIFDRKSVAPSRRRGRPVDKIKSCEDFLL